MAAKPTSAVMVSERFGSPPFDNCTFASARALADKATGKRINSAASVRALRKASGTIHGATGPDAVVTAFKKAFKWTVGKWSMSIDTLYAQMRQASSWTGAVMFVYPARLPAHFRRWDPKFDKGHALYVQGTSPAGVVNSTHLWIMDPMLAGKEKGYRGEWIRQDDLTAALIPHTPPVALKQGQFA